MPPRIWAQPNHSWPRGALLVTALLGWLVAIFFPLGWLPLGAQAASPVQVIRQIEWRPFGLYVSANTALTPEISWLSQPTRFVLDLPGAELADPHLARPITVKDPAIKGIRIARTPSGGLRIVVDCHNPVPVQVMSLRHRQDLILCTAQHSHQELATWLAPAPTRPAPAVVRGIHAKERGDTAELILGGLQNLRPILTQADATHLDIHLQGTAFKGALPAPGRLFKRFERVARPHGGWTIKVTLAQGFYHLEQTVDPRAKRVVLNWTKENPRRFADAPLILIDPGHGGSDPGAIGPNGRCEKDVCLGLGKVLRHSLLRRGINAVLTRSSDAELLLEPRLRMIDEIGADAFVSLHANSHRASDATGLETFYREPASQSFAELVHRHATVLLRRQNRGVKQERLFVLRHTRTPSLLLETGFISNPNEAHKLGDPSFQSQVAMAIASGLEDFFTSNQMATIRHHSLEN